MGTFPYSGPTLIDLLAKKHQAGPQAGLFRSGVFTIDWRAKVGSFLSPDLEMLISAGEPCGGWQPTLVETKTVTQGKKQTVRTLSRPEDKRTVEQNYNSLPELPLNGYVPGSSIRGIVRAWVMGQFGPNSPEFEQMQALLGYQQGDTVEAGKFQFLDAFPLERTPLTLDIVNPQQHFQVFHEGQSKPLSAYTLGDGEEEITVKVAIRGIAGQITPAEVDLVWSWITQALTTKGIGSRTASGYGQLSPTTNNAPQGLPSLPPGYACKVFDFTLWSQGNAGPKTDHPELRPTHWRGWLRSWLLRFFLGVMTPDNARYTVGELLGTLEESADGQQRLGSVSLRLKLAKVAGTPSQDTGFLRFYQWQGQVEITAPKPLLNQIILPIIRIAATVGGVGKGWRRPLHQFVMNNNQKPAARGCHLLLKHDYKGKKAPFSMPLRLEEWSGLYERWEKSVKAHYPKRFHPQNNVGAEVFSPRTCAVYIVAGPIKNPLDTAQNQWSRGLQSTQTRGQGMDLIYREEYKRQPDVGGNAAEGAGHCSWVTIKRMNTKDGQREIVCIFAGSPDPCGKPNPLRRSFLTDLQGITGAVHLFGDF